MHSQLRTIPVTGFYVCDEDEGVHTPDFPQDFDSANELLTKLRNANPEATYTLVAAIDA